MKLLNLPLVLASLLMAQSVHAKCTEEQVIQLLLEETNDVYAKCHIRARFEGATGTSLWFARVTCGNNEIHHFGLSLIEEGERCAIPWYDGIEEYK